MNTLDCWGSKLFGLFRGAVAFIESEGDDGEISIGTCFHVGEGSFITAKHVIEGRKITKIGFDDDHIDFFHDLSWSEIKVARENGITITSGPYNHKDISVDVSCFKAAPFPKAYIPLGGHLDDWLGQYDLVLSRALILGHPIIPFSNRPVLFASVGEVNALIDKYTGGHPHFILSATARGGFSGGPAIIGYSEDIIDNGAATLGLITESLISNGSAVELGYLAVLTVEPIFACLEQHQLLPKCQRFEE